MFLLYNFLLVLLSPVWVPWMVVRARRRGEQPNWAERQGNYALRPRKDEKRIWFHAVSVGEVLAATSVLRAVRARLPDYEIVLSTTTSSGNRTAREHAVGLYDHLVYFPIDVARFQLAAMQRVRPSVVVIMETELWMNFLWAAKVFKARTLLINGRISDRSFRRSLRFRPFFSALLRDMDRCLMQTQLDAERIRILGANIAEVTGNAKFDQALEGLSDDPTDWYTELQLDKARPILVIGSTRDDYEEDIVLAAINRLKNQNIQVVHAPRHLERVPTLLEKAKQARGLQSVGLRTASEQHDYLILDTYGELGSVYSVADVVIVGGGFSNLGGQNILQPLAHGKPVIHGPYMQNFREVTEAADHAGATRTCATVDELVKTLDLLLDDADVRWRMGMAAREFIERNRGAAGRYADAIAIEAQRAR